MLVFVWSLGQCSHSCGRGTQWRKVYCKQRLATGSYRRLSDEECAGTKPDVHRICINPDCLLPRLEGGEWSKVCVVCVAKLNFGNTFPIKFSHNLFGDTLEETNTL